MARSILPCGHPFVQHMTEQLMILLLQHHLQHEQQHSRVTTTAGGSNGQATTSSSSKVLKQPQHAQCKCLAACLFGIMIGCHVPIEMFCLVALLEPSKQRPESLLVNRHKMQVDAPAWLPSAHSVTQSCKHTKHKDIPMWVVLSDVHDHMPCA